MSEKIDWFELPESDEELKLLKSRSESGDSVASAKLAFMYASGTHVELDAELENKYSKLAESDHLSDCYFAHATSGSAVAYELLSVLHVKNLGRKIEPSIALSYLEKAAELGSESAMLTLGSSYIQGSLFIPENLKAAEKWLLMAAERGNIDSYSILYRLYENSFEDKEQALYWIKQGANAGSQFEMSKLWARYQDGDGVPKDLSESLKYYYLVLCQHESLNERRRERFKTFLNTLTKEEIRSGLKLAKDWISNHDESSTQSAFKGVRCDPAELIEE